MKLAIGLFLIFAQLLYFCDAKKCGEVLARGVNKTSQRNILKIHNDYRRQLANGEVEGQPRAINMKKLVWDESLAKQAQKIANTCNWGHIKQFDKRFGQLGQNIGIKESNGPKVPDWEERIGAWWNEHEIYKFSPFQSSDGSGHYTQIAWANTKYIGCGYIDFVEPKKQKRSIDYGYKDDESQKDQSEYDDGSVEYTLRKIISKNN